MGVTGITAPAVSAGLDSQVLPGARLVIQMAIAVL